jgi:YesN/AraC family two-component response regulator
MDISMPGMGGYQCLREMRAEHPTAKIIIASGYATAEHAREATELVASGFIGKPYRISDLISTVREVLDQA